MSGILSAIQAAGKIFAGYGTLTLGPVSFAGTELPEGMPISAAQDVAAQKFPGGKRILNIMGSDDPDITWSGIFYGQNASARIRLLESICNSGQEVTLAFDVFSYQVVLTAFQAKFRGDGAMPYSLTLMVVRNNSAAQGNSLVTVGSQVIADLQLGEPVAALSAVSGGVAAPITAAGTAAALPNASVVGSADYATAVNAVNSAATQINTTLASADTALAGCGTSLAQLGAGVSAGFDYLPVIGQIAGAQRAAGDQANLLVLRAYVCRAANNLASASA